VTTTAPTSVAPGDTLPPLTVQVTRADLVRYAGASGDFNPIHWSERFAVGVGLPNVIAHGMLTMALAGRLVTAWVGDPAAVVGYTARFTRPVVVPDDDEGVALELTGTVKAVEAAGTGGSGGAARVATVAVTAAVAGKTVLGRVTARVRLPA
jgi:acyl dehydratase